MPFGRFVLLSLTLLVLPAVGRAQSEGKNTLLGTWEAKADAEVHEIIIRADSSASYGTETVRWRIKADTMMIALGAEWVCYTMRVRGDKMTLSDGDLVEPISLKRVGLPSPRPDSIPVPADPMPGEVDVCF
ncbi:MAG: hypothetical protein V3T16_06730 [Gemmatimonadales bacterium]